MLSRATTRWMSTLPAMPRLGSFGLIADVQYADDEDGWNYRKTSKRYYRHGLQVLKWATNDWVQESNASSSRGEPAMSFAVDLGDVIDGKNEPVGQSMSALAATKAEFDKFQSLVGPVHHCVGNHELYNFNKATYVQELTRHTASPHAKSCSVPPSNQSVAYYAFTVPEFQSYTFLVLDPYGESVIGSPEGSEEHARAVETLNRENPNENKNSPLGLPRNESLRFTAFNGAVDSTQFEWLRGQLEEAQRQEKDVVIFTHVPIHPDTCRPGGVLLWNYPEVKALLEQYASNVRVVFSGHSHKNGYAYDNGIHYMVFHAALECDPSTSDAENRAYASVDVFKNELRVRGFGVIPSRVLSWQSKL